MRVGERVGERWPNSGACPQTSAMCAFSEVQAARVLAPVGLPMTGTWRIPLGPPVDDLLRDGRYCPCDEILGSM